MQPQTKPTLESIFGEQETLSSASNSSRPSLDSILGVNKPVATPVDKVKAIAGGIAEGVGATIGLGAIDWTGRKLIEKLPEDTKFAGVSKADMLKNLDASPDLQKKFETMMSKDKAPELYEDSEVVGLVAGLLPAGVMGARMLAGTKPVRAVRDFGVGLATPIAKGVKNVAKGFDSDVFTSTVSSPEVAPFIQKSPENIKTVQEALKQGFEEKDIKFMATLAEADKPTIRKMKELAESASGNLRVQERPMDIVGNNGLTTIRQIQKINEESGSLVDKTARDLAGSEVDATAVQATAISALERLGIKVMDAEAWNQAVADAIAQGKRIPSRLNFSESSFKKFPELQKKIDNALSDLPTGMVDAYDLHKFKKSLDEFKNYESTGGKGLTTSLENLVGEIRATSDNVLDTTFEAYNKANTDFRKTKEILDEAYSVAGKKTDFLSKQGAQDLGQALRSLFSNNKSRGKVNTFLQNLQTTADEFGVASDQNLVDQALFAQILESVYGTQAVTGLAGETTKAIRRAMDIVDRPVGGTLDLIVEKVGKMRDMTPEAKKKVIDLFIGDTTPPNSFSVGTVPKTVSKSNTILEEAKNYSSAKEFIKAQKAVFHGTNETFDKIDLNKSKRNMFGRGFSVTNNKEVTKYYGDKTKRFYISPEAKIYKSDTKEIKENDYNIAKDLYREVYKKELPIKKIKKESSYREDVEDARVFWKSENTEVIKAKELYGNYLRENGYDAVQESDTLNFLNPEKLLTEEQLIEIYNQTK